MMLLGKPSLAADQASQLGGLSKKAYQMEKIQKLHELPYLTLDGGNLLFKQSRLSPALLQQAKITAEGITDSYNFMQLRCRSNRQE